MLSPEVWDFSPPSNSLITTKNVNDNAVIQNCIKSHFFNHLVSVALPDTPTPPSSLEEALSVDCDYYKVTNLGATTLLEQEFIEGFVKQGQVTLMSIGTKLDIDDCIAVTPTGHLILSLRREIYQELGLEGTPTFTKDKDPQRYVVNVDLTAEHFVPGKRNCENTKKAVKERLPLVFDVLVAWDPRDESVCPSSIAAYLAKCGFHVNLCRPKNTRSIKYDVSIPSLSPDTNIEDFLEWLGALSIGVPLSATPDPYLSSFHPWMEIDGIWNESSNVAILNHSGFFTSAQIIHLLKALSDVLTDRKSLPWISMHVQGFEDAVVSWGLKEHHYYTDGDNSYTIILKPEGGNIVASNISNQRLIK